MKRGHGGRQGKGHRGQRAEKPESRGSVSPERRHLGNCADCGKHRFATRQDARAAWKVLHRYSPMSVYRCGEYWHYGHNWRKNA